MKLKLTEFLKDWKIILMIILLAMSFIAIQPRLDSNGAVIVSASAPASNYIQKDMIITAINGVKITNAADFNLIASQLKINDTVQITYREKGYFKQEKTTYPFLAIEKEGEAYLGISAADLEFSEIEFGIDLIGGSKITLSPNEQVSMEELESAKMILENRLNVYGFKEIPINILTDLSGNNYLIIELPLSISVDDVERLLESEGVFEARVANETVFYREDIMDICMVHSDDCPSRVMAAPSGGFQFTFGLLISETGAQRFADATKDLQKSGFGQSCYLEEKIGFYLDGELLEGSELDIGCSLAGTLIRNPVISGGASTREEAALRMRELKSMIQSDKLPISMNIDDVQVISPRIGHEFLSNIVMVFFIAIISVDLIIAIRYKSLAIAVPIIIATLSEIFITIGAATMMGWTFDIAAIAGLIASIGTGVDDQIIITDEVLNNKGEAKDVNLKQKFKNAFFVVFAAFTTSIAVMIPLNFAGAGMLKGFASTNIIAISIGVLITRPAYAKILEIMERQKII